MRAPAIVDAQADARFREIARMLHLDPDDPWIGGYVQYEWSHGRHVFETLGDPIAGARLLEFGCNVGATSVVLALLGARVTALDVDEGMVRLARENAARHGVGVTAEFLHVPDTTRLPFGDGAFDLVCCNSVLEYVPHDILPAVQQEIDRVLRPGGMILVTGTSSRLWPREVHSRRWFSNWLPRAVDRLLGWDLQRGVFPWQMSRGFGPAYANLDREDGGLAWIESRARMRGDGGRPAALEFLRRYARLLGTTPGLCTPSISVRLRKRDTPGPTT